MAIIDLEHLITYLSPTAGVLVSITVLGRPSIHVYRKEGKEEAREGGG
jgi:hypothetical protein